MFTRERTAPNWKTVLRVAAAWMMLAMIAGCGSGVGDTTALEPTVSIMTALTETTEDGDLLGPLDGSTVTGTVQLVVEAKRSIDSVSFYLDDGSEPIEVDEEAPFELVLDTAGLSDGEHVLVAMTPFANGRKEREEARASFVVANTTSPAPVDGDTSEPVEDGAPSSGEGEPEPDTDVEPEPDHDGDPVDEPEQDVHYQGPIVITSGGTYSGNWESLDSNVPAVKIATREPVVIENANIRSAGHLIVAPWTDAHVTVRNVYGKGLYPTVSGRTAGRFLVVEGYRYVEVTNSYLDGTAGIYLNAADGATVKILRNRARNIDGRRADGNGGYSGTSIVQFVQFNAGQNLRDTEVAWNEVVNEPFESAVEDVISTYKTTGTSGDPVRIHDNYIHGAYPADPRNDSYSGGGIMLGDAGGAYLHAYRNIVVATSNYGIAISGGSHNRIVDNTVVSCGVLEDGSPIASQNIGIYVWNMHGEPAFGDNGGTGNRVGWARDGGSRGDWWVPDATLWESNQKLADVSCTAERDQYVAWLDKTMEAQATIGTTGR